MSAEMLLHVAMLAVAIAVVVLAVVMVTRYEAEREAAVRRRDEFLAVLAHELRNPLVAIRNSVQILEKVPDDVERVVRGVETIDRQTALLVRLIDDLLDVARVSQGFVDLNVEPCRLSTLISSAIEATRAIAPDSRHSIVIEHQVPGAAVMVDAVRAEQVFVNLLKNAMQYSAAGSSIEVKSRIQGRYAQIDVVDHGQGIPAELLSHIFVMFAHSKGTANHRIGGLGVGLGFAKQLVQRLGGSISAASEGWGKGATFTVALPLASVPAHATGEARSTR